MTFRGCISTAYLLPGSNMKLQGILQKYTDAEIEMSFNLLRTRFVRGIIGKINADCRADENKAKRTAWFGAKPAMPCNTANAAFVAGRYTLLPQQPYHCKKIGWSINRVPNPCCYGEIFHGVREQKITLALKSTELLFFN